MAILAAAVHHARLEVVRVKEPRVVIGFACDQDAQPDGVEVLDARTLVRVFEAATNKHQTYVLPGFVSEKARDAVHDAIGRPWRRPRFKADTTDVS